MDLPRVVGCLPGARLTERCGPERYRGEMKVRLGPVTVTFVGTAQLTELDPVARSALLKVEGRDKNGRGGAAADMRFVIVPAGTVSQVVVTTQLTLSGAVAQYGRGSAMIVNMSNLLVSEFAANLRVELTSSTFEATLPGSDALAESGARNRPLNPIRLAITLFGQLIARSVRRVLGRRT